jgi:DNA-binding transcriptional MerR regulator
MMNRSGKSETKMPSAIMDESNLCIGELGRRSGLARSTLLYYDTIGLLQPSGRAANNYRTYSSADLARLDRIMVYRDAGVPLSEIKALLDSLPAGTETNILKRRLSEMNDAIRKLRLQQELTLRLLRGQNCREPHPDRGAFLEVLTRIGMSDAQGEALHREFEAIAPDEHERFLRFIGLGDKEICLIRAQSASKP